MSSFDANKVLHPSEAIESIDDILYSIGLCHQSVRECPKRSRLHSPSLIAGVVLLYIIKRPFLLNCLLNFLVRDE
jgi:hypothetical protein